MKALLLNWFIKWFLEWLLKNHYSIFVERELVVGKVDGGWKVVVYCNVGHHWEITFYHRVRRNET